MEQKFGGLCFTFVILALVQIFTSALAKDPRECEVCISVLDKFMKHVPEDKRNDQKVLEKELEKFCKTSKEKDHKFCVNIGAIENSPTRIVDKVTQPLSWLMPVDKVCEKLKKADSQLCELRYDKKIDLTETNLKKLRVNELKKILSSWGEDAACKGCAEKDDFIRAIERLMPQHDPEAFKKRQTKTDL